MQGTELLIKEMMTEGGIEFEKGVPGKHSDKYQVARIKNYVGHGRNKNADAAKERLGGGDKRNC